MRKKHVLGPQLRLRCFFVPCADTSAHVQVSAPALLRGRFSKLPCASVQQTVHHPPWCSPSRARGLSGLSGLDSNEDGGLYASPWHSDPNVAFHLVGLNLFHMLFGVDVSEHLAALNEYDGLLAPAVLGIFRGEDNAARLAEIRAQLEDLVLNAEIGKRYIAAVDADATMGRGEDRLKEMLFVAQFAGYAGTGTLTSRTIKHIQTDPAKYIPMFRQNKEAFMLEAARLFPPVAGMNFYVIPEATTRTFGAGITHTAQAGDFGIIHSTGANRDPTFWGDDADEFKPGRPNAQKLMSVDLDSGTTLELGCRCRVPACPALACVAIVEQGGRRPT